MAKQSRCFALTRAILMVTCAIVMFFFLLFGLIRYWYYTTGFYPYQIQFEHGDFSFTQLVTGAELAQSILDIDETRSISYTIFIWILIACIAFLYYNVFGGFTQAESVSLEPSKPGLLSHEWTIEDFGDYLNGGKMNWKKKLNSKEFSTSDGSVKFYLSLHPNGNGVENKDHLSVSLHLTKESDVKFNCTFSLVDGLRKHFKSVIDKALPKEGFGYPNFFSHSDLKKSANNYLSQNKLTIRVDIEDVACKLIRGYHETRSTTSTNCHVHIWTIENYSSFRTGYAWKWELQEYIESNKFTTSNRNLPEFYLRLHPNGDEDNDYIALYLMSCVHKSEIVFNCTFAIFGNGVATIKEFKHKFVDSNVGHVKFISLADLLDSKKGYLPNDKLIIYCVISDQNEELIRGCTVTRSTTTDSFFG